MKKVTKGVLAAGLGVGLLVSGAGTLAYWTEAENIGGGTINSGHLTLTAAGACTAWVLDSGEGTTTYADGDPIVPGDQLTRECSYTVGAQGDHLRAVLGTDVPVFSGTDSDFLGMLDVTTVASIAGTTVTEITDANDGETLLATVTVTFDSAALDDTENLTTVLDTIVLTATQEHN